MKIVAVIIVAAFTVGGAFQAIKLANNISGTYTAKNWIATPAKLLSWERLSGYGAGGLRPGSTGSRRIDRLVASYEYHANGQTYKSDRVGFTEVYDNFSDDYRDAIIERLRVAEETQSPLTVWVNPAAPEQAVIERSLPVASSIFSAFFLLFPCGLASIILMTLFCSWICRWIGANHDQAARNIVMPLWAILHGSLALPIIALAPAGSIGLGASFILGLLLMLMVGGIYSFRPFRKSKTNVL